MNDLSLATPATSLPEPTCRIGERGPLEPRLRIDGEWTEATAHVEVFDPFDGSLVGRAPRAGADEMERALTAARRYADAPLAVDERAALLQRWADAMLEVESMLAETLCRENGKPIRAATVEVRRACATVRSYADASLALDAEARSQLGRVLGGQAGAEANAEGFVAPVLHQPLGVVAAFTPFNFPANTVVHKMAAALGAGNAIVLKPSEKTPLTALLLAELLHEVGAPQGAAAVLSGHYSDFAALLDDARVDFFTMTGHSEVGARLARRFGSTHPFAGRHFELGGNAPQIVLADIDPGEAAALLAHAVFDHNGSRCTTPRKVLLPDGDWADAFIDAARDEAGRWTLGAPLDPTTALGPLIDEAAAETVAARIQDALSKGAQRIVGGRRFGAAIEATVLDRVRPGMRIVDEENFGPVLSVMRYRDVDEAVRIGNLGDYGLQPAVLTRDLRAGHALASRLRGGTLNIGLATTAHRSDLAPFGGVGASGVGREGGIEGVREMSRPVAHKFYLPEAV